MLNYIWGFFILISVVYSYFTKSAEAVTNAVFDSAGEAVQLVISMAGMLCFWNGIMEIAERSGAADVFSRVFKPVLKRLFPQVSDDSPAFRYISLNISANLLGIGNAATPFGLSAMKALQEENPDKTTASDPMILFVVLNTASLQIIPTTLLTLRTAYGSTDPYCIIPPIWVSSILTVVFAITLVKALSAFDSRRLC